MSNEIDNLDGEIWRDCIEFPNRYEVSNFGRVKSKSYIKNSVNGYGAYSFRTKVKLIAQGFSGDGYPQVVLQEDKTKVTRKVHRLVAMAFIANPNQLPCVNHKNSIRSDNRVENLEWCTNQQNIQHGYSSGSNSNSGEKHPRAILNNEVVLEIKRLEKLGSTCSEISNKLSFKYHTVNKVLKRRNWANVEPESETNSS